MTLVKEKNNADQLFLHELILKPFINKTLKLNKITSIGVLNVQRCKKSIRVKKLAEIAKTTIFININSKLLELLLSENNNEFFNISNTNNMLTEKAQNRNYNLRQKNNITALLGNNGIFGNTLLQNNANNSKRIKNWNSEYPEETMKGILFRRFLHKSQFKNFGQYSKMKDFIREYWNPQLFVNVIDYSIPSFLKRLKLNIKSDKTNRVNCKPILELDSIIENGVELLPVVNILIEKYGALKSIMDYIQQDDDEYRKKFAKWVCGSEYSNSDIILYVRLYDGDTRQPYQISTCFNYIIIYVNKKEFKKDFNQKSFQSVENIDSIIAGTTGSSEFSN